MFKVIRIRKRKKINFVIENPLTSMLWKFTELNALIRDMSQARVDVCQYGERWRKRTKLIGDINELPSFERVCKGKVCSATGLPHFKLEGKDPKGLFYTKRAEPYPRALCRSIASIIAAKI